MSGEPHLKNFWDKFISRKNETSQELKRPKLGQQDAAEGSPNYYPNCDVSVWMRSCEQEVIEPIIGKVTGNIPKWLKGTLIRNGPGCLKVGEYTFDHLFDSSALLHRFGIFNGKVTYQRRFVQTEVFKRNHAAKKIVITEFGTRAVPDPCQSIFHRISAAFSPTADDSSDNTMISVYPFGDEFYTFTESPVIHRIDPDTLETVGKVNLADHISIVSHTSHPHVMPDGTVYNLGLSISSRGPAYCIVCFSPKKSSADETDKDGKSSSMFDSATIVASVQTRWVLNPSYMHTFGITDNYFIIVEQPLSIALLTMFKCRLQNEPMCSCLKWQDKQNTLIHVVSRKSGKLVKKFKSEAFFYFHIINQFESADKKYVIVDICAYRDAKVLDCMYINAIKDMHRNPDYANLFRGRPLRFILPMEDDDSLASKRLEENLIRLKTVNQSMMDDLEIGSPLLKKASAHRLPNGDIFVQPELLCDLGLETPRINYDNYLGKEYRYFYGISSDVDIENPGTIIKVDTVNKSKRTWFEKNVYPSEPIFVPDPNAKNEDDGVVLSVLLWGKDRETEVGLLILNASTLEEIGRATFVTPGPVPKCLHGWFSFKT